MEGPEPPAERRPGSMDCRPEPPNRKPSRSVCFAMSPLDVPSRQNLTLFNSDCLLKNRWLYSRSRFQRSAKLLDRTWFLSFVPFSFWPAPLPDLASRLARRSSWSFQRQGEVGSQRRGANSVWL